MSDWINAIFAAPLKAVFHPINAAIADIYMPWARICALGLFIVTIIWVFSMRKEYVNLDGPKAFWADLRIWTILAMLPHLIVYFYL